MPPQAEKLEKAGKAEKRKSQKPAKEVKAVVSSTFPFGGGGSGFAEAPVPVAFNHLCDAPSAGESPTLVLLHSHIHRSVWLVGVGSETKPHRRPRAVHVRSSVLFVFDPASSL